MYAGTEIIKICLVRACAFVKSCASTATQSQRRRTLPVHAQTNGSVLAARILSVRLQLL
jgi:hypothetical protein